VAVSAARIVALAGTLAAVGCTGTRLHSTVNAPGKVVLAPPAYENGKPELYVEPTDPGEHEVYLGPGVVVGPATGRYPRTDGDAGVELGFYLRLAYKEVASSHRKDDVPWPAPGWALNVGWSPLQYTDDASFGPLFFEVERQWFLGSIGAGLAVYPQDGGAGAQVTAAWKPYGVRVRYVAETGWEVMGAFQVELPSAVTWSR
jgi:hypothetical protein